MDELRKRGIVCHALPVTEISFLKNDLPDLLKFNWLAFTSVNGVTAFADLLDKNKRQLPGNLKIAAVGSATRKAAKDRFGKTDRSPLKSDGLSLADSILETASDHSELTILWPCGQDALPRFYDRLTQAGAKVNKWICYRTEAVDPMKIKAELLKLPPWDLALFAAPSAVRAFSAAWEKRNDFAAFAIGPTTADALRDEGYIDVVISGGADSHGCADSIVELFKKRNVDFR